MAAVGGFLDAFTYVRHGVFATAQTGNIVLLAIDAADGRWQLISVHVPPILAFLAGVGVAETLAGPRLRELLRRPARVVLIGEITVLLGIGALPAATPSWAVTVAISFVAALQISTFTLLGDTTYNTTMVTGNLRSMLAAAFQWMLNRDRAAGRRATHLGLVIVAFIAGAIVSALLTNSWGKWAICVAAGILAVVLVMLALETRGIERKAAAATHPTA